MSVLLVGAGLKTCLVAVTADGQNPSRTGVAVGDDDRATIPDVALPGFAKREATPAFDDNRATGVCRNVSGHCPPSFLLSQ